MNPDLSFVPAADVSVNAINSLIGVGWDGILTGNNPSGAGGVLLTIMAVFNGVALGVAGILIFYTTLAGIIDTAHQGEAMGKARSTLYVPLRLVGGISMLMPLPWCHASLLQAIILKCVFLSIAGADYVNTQVTNQITANGGTITSPALPENINAVATNLLEGLTIQTFFNVGMDMPSVQGLNVVATPNGQSYVLGLNPPDPALNGSMGHIEVPCSLGQGDPVCQARVNAIQAMLPNLQTAANAITSHWQYGANQYPDPNSMIGAMSSYQSAVQSAMVSWMQSQQPAEDSALSQFAQTVQNTGWASLGSYYWTFAHFNAAVATVAAAQAKIGATPDYEVIGNHVTGDFEVSKGQLKRYLKRVSNIASTTGNVGIASANEKYSAGWIAQLFPAVIAANAGTNVVADLSVGDPIVNLQTRGQQLVSGAELAGLAAAAMYGAIHAASGAADGARSSLLGLVGIGILAKAPAEFAVGASDFAKDTIHQLISGCFFVGLVLSVWLPAVPFIIWTMAFVGWLALIVEAIFAAPVWAIAHALPEGDGFVGQSAKRGYMLLLNILLRPALMTTGFFCSYLLIQPVGQFIGAGFQVYTSGLMSNANLGASAAPAAAGLLGLGVSAFVSGLATILLGGVILAMAEHSVFSIITMLPENIMRWVEGQMGGLGEHEKESKMQNLIMANFSRMESAVKGKPGGGSGRLGRVGGRFSRNGKDE